MFLQTLIYYSVAGTVLKYGILVSDDGREFSVTSDHKYPSLQELLKAHRSVPIQDFVPSLGHLEVFLLHPIPVDPELEKKHKPFLEGKGKNG